MGKGGGGAFVCLYLIRACMRAYIYIYIYIYCVYMYTYVSCIRMHVCIRIYLVHIFTCTYLIYIYLYIFRDVGIQNLYVFMHAGVQYNEWDVGIKKQIFDHFFLAGIPE
jgi:hypothetical protein